MAFDINSLPGAMPTALGNATRWDPMAQQAYTRILELLKNPGLSPAQLSRSIVDRSRMYQGAEGAAMGKFARRGLEGSGLAGAVATGMKANAVRDADILRRKFAAENESRKQKAIGLYSNMVMFPQMGAYQRSIMDSLQQGRERLDSANDRMDQWGTMATSLGSVAGAFNTPTNNDPNNPNGNNNNNGGNQ